MATTPSVDETKFQSQLNGAALDYYKRLLPDMALRVDLKGDDFINTLSNDSSIDSILNHYNLNPSRIQSKFDTNRVGSHRRNSLNTVKKHNIPTHRRNSVPETHPIPNTHQTRYTLDTNQKHKPLNHQTATSQLVDIGSIHGDKTKTWFPLLDIIETEQTPAPHECKEEWVTNLHAYCRRHTELFINIAVRKKRENIDDLNMFKHDINQNIGSFMKYIVPKLKKLHLKNRVCCAVKPGNVYMDFDIDPHEPIRFGLNETVMCCTNGTKLLDVDQNAKYIGSVGYNPPEIFMDDKSKVAINTSFDIWSLGITLLQLLNGEHPFLYDLTLEYGADNVMNGSLEGVINQAYIDEIVEYNHVLIWSKHKLFRDLLLHMLQVNVQERYTIHDISSHKWYQKYCT